MGSFGRNHDGFFKNLYDPLGIIPGKKGFLGLGSEKKDAPPPIDTPKISSGDDEDAQRLKRIGRAQLISSSQRGVLSEPNTSNKKLFGVQ